jgi:hypothetical protein
VVFEVNEAGVLEAVEDSVGCLLLLGGVAGEEGCEVDELGRLEREIWRRGGRELTGMTRSSCATALSTVMSAMVSRARGVACGQRVRCRMRREEFRVWIGYLDCATEPPNCHAWLDDIGKGAMPSNSPCSRRVRFGGVDYLNGKVADKIR